MYLIYIAAALTGYLFGCISPVYIIARRKGIDILKHGSGNPGASNAWILMGKNNGVIVGAADILKGFLPAMAAMLLFPELNNIGIVAGASAVIGHIFPVFMKFRGGKGFAAYLGMVFAFNWIYFIAAVAAVAILTAVTDYIAIGTYIAVIAFPLCIALIDHNYIGAAIAGAVSLLIIYKHIPNLIRIIKGEEIGLRKSGNHRIDGKK